MASVNFLVSVGGDGSTVTDDDNVTTGLDAYGYVTRFVPALSQVVAIASNTVTKATEAAASAASALGAPGTNANSTTSLLIGTGSKAFTIETGKQFSIGQTVVAASKANPANQMTGVITAHNSGTGALTVDVSQTGGSGTFADWTVALSAIVSNVLPSQTGNGGKFLTTDGTNASWAAVLIPSNNLSDLANAATARTNLGLDTIATQAANSVAITGGTITGITDLAIADGGTGASTAAGARTNLGLLALATKDTINNADWSGTALAITNGGTGATTASGARSALGLGSAAVVNTGTGSSDVPTTAQADGRYLRQGRHTIPIVAPGMIARVTNGPSAGITETTTNKVMVRSLDFDQSTVEYAQFAIPMPKNWDEGTFTAQLIWSTTAGSGNVIWGVQAQALSNDDALDTAFGTAVTVTDGVTAANDVMISDETAALTVGGAPAEGDLVIFQIYRDAAAGGDTLAADAKLLGIKLYFNINAANDA